MLREIATVPLAKFTGGLRSLKRRHPDFNCLDPAPFSALAFTNIMQHLAKNRRVIAPNFPGLGSSDLFKAPPPIAEYAEAMLLVATGLSSGQPIDLMGFHTGNRVAVEMALTAPD